MNPAHGTISIILHVFGYAGGMVALFVLARYAIVWRNVLAKKMRGKKEEELGGKGFQLDDRSDTWSTKIGGVKSTPMRVHKSFEVVVTEV